MTTKLTMYKTVQDEWVGIITDINGARAFFGMSRESVRTQVVNFLNPPINGFRIATESTDCIDQGNDNVVRGTYTEELLERVLH